MNKICYIIALAVINVLVAGNSLFRHKSLDLASAIKELRSNAN